MSLKWTKVGISITKKFTQIQMSSLGAEFAPPLPYLAFPVTPLTLLNPPSPPPPLSISKPPYAHHSPYPTKASHAPSQLFLLMLQQTMPLSNPPY